VAEYQKIKSNSYAETIRNVRGEKNVSTYITVLGARAILSQDARDRVVHINTRKTEVKDEQKKK